MFAWLRRTFFSSSPLGSGIRPYRMVRARYDSALTTDNNRRHWANADGLSAITANNFQVRRTHELKGHTGQITDIAVTPPRDASSAGTVVSSSWDGTLRIWKLPVEEPH